MLSSASASLRFSVRLGIKIISLVKNLFRNEMELRSRTKVMQEIKVPKLVNNDNVSLRDLNKSFGSFVPSLEL
jgi:hypothetical protein